MKRFFTHHAATYSLLAPYLIGALLLVIIPAGLAFALAFYRYDGLMTPAWRGWGNFIDVAFDPLFWIALANSLFFIVVAVPLRLLAALGLAPLLRRPWLPLGAAGALLLVAGSAYGLSAYYGGQGAAVKGQYGRMMAYVAANAQPGDALLLANPLQRPIFEYYRPPGLEAYYFPRYDYPLEDERTGRDLAGIAGQTDVAGCHAGLGGLLLLAGDIELAGPVVADEHGGQAHGGVTRGVDGGPQAGDRLVAQAVAIHQDCAAGRAIERELRHDGSLPAVS